MDTLNLRIVHTHDTEENWNKCAEFIPRRGENIVYDIDGRYSYERLKIGDGIHTITELPFVIDSAVLNIFNATDNIVYLDPGRITKYPMIQEEL